MGDSVAYYGDGTLGTLSFELMEGFSGTTQINLIENIFRFEGGGYERYEVLSSFAITSDSAPVPVVGDFDGNGKIDFIDFFVFADAFGGTDPRFDLDGSGQVDFGDFFLFADNFGKEVREKLFVLARRFLGLPSSPVLGNNYPNPFNNETTIPYQIDQPGEVVIEIFDVQGQRIKSLVHGYHQRGKYQVKWNGKDDQDRNVSSGVYLIRMRKDFFSVVRRTMLLK